MQSFCSSNNHLENEKANHRLGEKITIYISDKEYACRICEDSYKSMLKINIKKKVLNKYFIKEDTGRTKIT